MCGVRGAHAAAGDTLSSACPTCLIQCSLHKRKKRSFLDVEAFLQRSCQSAVQGCAQRPWVCGLRPHLVITSVCRAPSTPFNEAVHLLARALRFGGTGRQQKAETDGQRHATQTTSPKLTMLAGRSRIPSLPAPHSCTNANQLWPAWTCKSPASYLRLEKKASTSPRA